MTAQHTPGPWFHAHRKGNDAMFRTEVFSEQHGGIATCDWTPKHCGNGVTATYREANARLIAAAPDLLDALIELNSVSARGFLYDDPARVKARTAIAKATGSEA